MKQQKRGEKKRRTLSKVYVYMQKESKKGIRVKARTHFYVLCARVLNRKKKNIFLSAKELKKKKKRANCKL
jgi:hypothetical protein